MLSTAAILFLSSLGAFILYFVLVSVEYARGKRIILASGRGWVDKIFITVASRVRGTYDHFSKYVVQLGWYYSVHSFLRTVLRMLVATYEYFESHFELNRKRAKQLRAEKQERLESQRTHLTEMAEHKVETALTPAQQKKVRKKHLDGKM